MDERARVEIDVHITRNVTIAESALLDRPFRWVGGVPCLDFNNTVGWPDVRGEPWPYPWSERLTSFDRLAQWGLEAQLLSDSDAVRQTAIAARRPDEGRQVLERAHTLRDAVHWLLAGLATETPLQEQDLEILNCELREGRGNRRLEATPNGVVWTWTDDQDLGRVLWLVAESTADLLVSERLDQLRLCAGDRCGWMFLNVSGRRRWCVMSDCGNRAKARRHYQRTRTLAG